MELSEEVRAALDTLHAEEVEPGTWTGTTSDGQTVVVRAPGSSTAVDDPTDGIF